MLEFFASLWGYGFEEYYCNYALRVKGVGVLGDGEGVYMFLMVALFRVFSNGVAVA